MACPLAEAIVFDREISGVATGFDREDMEIAAIVSDCKNSDVVAIERTTQPWLRQSSITAYARHGRHASLIVSTARVVSVMPSPAARRKIRSAAGNASGWPSARIAT